MPISLNDQEINELVQQTDKWSGKKTNKENDINDSSK